MARRTRSFLFDNISKRLVQNTNKTAKEINTRRAANTVANTDILTSLETDTKISTTISNTGINTLSDISIANVEADQVLQYNANTGDWENETLSLVSSIDGLTDTNFTSLSNGDYLVYSSSGSEWINSALDLSSYVTDTDIADYSNTAQMNTAIASSNTAMKNYVDAEVAGIVNSAPAALDTLNELAAALGDDANFSTTTSTALGNRLRIDTNAQSLTGTEKTNALTNLGITATVAELNYIDGVTSNIQTQLDAKGTSSFSGAYADLTGKPSLFSGAYADLTGKPTIPTNNNQLTNGAGYITTTSANNSLVQLGAIQLYNNEKTTYTAAQGLLIYDQAGDNCLNIYNDNLSRWVKIWDDSNDGASSGLDADLLDGQHGSYYLNYNNLSNKPTIPTNNNQLTNGAGYAVRTTSSFNGTYNIPVVVSDSTLYYTPNAGGVTITGSTGQITTPSHGNSSQWNTAYGWGNHASAGYITSTVSGSFTATGEVNAYSGAIDLRSDGIYFESGDHCITWNDGQGNFNIRVGNNPSETCTEAGYAFHDEWSQSGGWREFNISSASLAVGNSISWRPQIYYDYNKVSLRYQGSEKLATVSDGVSVTGNVTATTGFYIADTNTRLHEGSGNSVRVTTNSGYLDIGAQNASYAHLQTDRGLFYFNTTVQFDGGGIRAYDGSADARFPIYYDSNDTAYYCNPASTSRLNVSYNNETSHQADHGRGVRFWNSDSYKIYMSSTGNSTWGGSVANAATSDYNMYFRMTGGTNRGFVFKNNTTAVAQIDGSGIATFSGVNGSGQYLNVKYNATGGGGARLYDSEGVVQSYWYGSGAGEGGLLDNDANWFCRARTGTSSNIFYCNNNAELYVYTSYVRAIGSFRAPIYYDFNNTAYYAHLDSTSDSIRAAGDIVAYYSDERLKDIHGNIENALDKVCTLDGFYYTPNEIAQKLGYKKEKTRVGLSAQQVQAILPEVIKDCPADNKYMTVDYAKIVPLLVEAIKELKSEIEELKK